MAIIFKEEGHVYESTDQDKINWTSVTSFIGMFKPKFDAKAQAKKSAKNKRSKWYGMTEKEILQAYNYAIKGGKALLITTGTIGSLETLEIINKSSAIKSRTSEEEYDEENTWD